MDDFLSQELAVVATIDPDAYATGTQDSDWVNMENFDQVMWLVLAGTLGSSATLDFNVTQATDGAGAGEKAITGKSITQLTQAGTDDDKQAIVIVKAEELDVANRFGFIRGRLIIGTATSDAGVVALGGRARWRDASQFDLATVDEIVT